MFNIKNTPHISLIYASTLAVTAFALLIVLSVRTGLQIPNVPAFAGFILCGILVSVFGFPAPHVGYVSLDRVVQFASILIFGTLQAAWISGIALLIWSLLPRGDARYQDLRLSIVRALNNSGMIIIIVLMTGGIYEYFNGTVPLLQLNPHDALLIIILALFMQLTNEMLVALFAWFENYDWGKSFNLFSTIVELAAVPAAVFTAITYNRLATSIFLLYLTVLLLVILVVKNFADTRRALEVKVDELVAVNRVGRAVSSLLVLDELVDLIFRESRNLLEFDSFMLALYDETSGEIDIRLHHNRQGRQPQRRQKVGEGLMGWVITNNKPVFIKDWDKDDSNFKRIMINIGDTPQTKSLITVPVTYRNNVLGVISVQGYTPDKFSKPHVDLMVTFAGQVAVAIANARLFEELDQNRNELERRVVERTRALALQKDELHALTDSLRNTNHEKEELLLKLQQQTSELERQTEEDGLTGLYNRRFLDRRLGFEVKRAERYNRHIALAMGDIDHFKVVNDRYSHMVGDDVLRALADILRRQSRSVDIIARYGGEEFLLCFPETSLENAASVCEKIRQQVEGYDWDKIQAGLRVNISFGVAAAPPGYDVDQLIAAADERLYEAKHSGRNQVCA
ncbi:MAG: diguanylate cyclase [Gammaproteobacteria bacterium]|nr:diguanylate cyclase [Gammaproteobacteria bacterium]